LEQGTVHLDHGGNNVPTDIMIAGIAAHVRILNSWMRFGLLTILKRLSTLKK